ncbi:MAG: hypothetical protein LBE81_10000 [Azonexus sp.]|jgi:hypothetical protein|uniref:hypothetical protein n=1 Tax=Azonexus sp. TaxID=1872668 RepID=UPI002839D56B|nr:hypothetical protein [Azonexus sp.]MDR0776950.1 hypothetical protein [Azonexus sp.]
MNITPRHLAAGQFTIIGTFCLASWWVLLSPIDRAAEQLRYIFAPGYELRQFFIWLSVSSIFTIAVAFAYWFRSAGARPFSSVLLGAAAFLFVSSLWWFDGSFIVTFTYGLGLFCAAWVWFRPNTTVKRDAPPTTRPLP